MDKKQTLEPIEVSTQNDINFVKEHYPTRQKIKFTCIYCGKLGIRQMRHVYYITDLSCPYCKQRNTLKSLYSNPENRLNAKLKREETCLQRYGVKHVLQCDEFKKKSEETCLRNYGVKHNSQSDIIKQKVREHTDYDLIVEKSRQTCIQKYGVESVNSTDWKKQKIKDTIKSKYGPEYESTSQLQFVINKSRFTRFTKWGSWNPPTICKFRRKNIYMDGLYFDSSWELCFYMYYRDHNLYINCHTNDYFTYVFNNNLHHYYPDFKIGSYFIEIKGDHFFDGDKMICPFDRSLDQKFEAKHQCMLKNNVIILKSTDICFYVNYVVNHYPNDFLKRFNIKPLIKNS